MAKTRWQFSLLALLVLTTAVSVVVAFATNYPLVAIVLLAATVWVGFESGAIVQIVIGLSQPKVYNRHPFLATAIWFFTGTLSVFFGGVLSWAAISPSSNAPFWAPILPGIGFTAFGFYCLRLIYISFKLPLDSKNEQETKDRQNNNPEH